MVQKDGKGPNRTSWYLQSEQRRWARNPQKPRREGSQNRRRKITEKPPLKPGGQPGVVDPVKCRLYVKEDAKTCISIEKNPQDFTPHITKDDL